MNHKIKSNTGEPLKLLRHGDIEDKILDLFNQLGITQKACDIVRIAAGGDESKLIPEAIKMRAFLSDCKLDLILFKQSEQSGLTVAS